MKGDVLIIGERHRNAARQIISFILPDINHRKGRYIITVAGESGAGKSEVAASMAELLNAENIRTYLFQQDDFFYLPPKTNARARLEDIDHVGITEVRMELLNEIVEKLKQGMNVVEKPLVLFDEDKVTTEMADLTNYKVVIIEGTYTTSLHNIDCRIFIDRDLNDTRADRLTRNREIQDEYLEKILQIEHQIISAQKSQADIIISKEFNASKNNFRDEE